MPTVNIPVVTVEVTIADAIRIQAALTRAITEALRHNQGRSAFAVHAETKIDGANVKTLKVHITPNER